jgi:hypothetical protein
MRSAVCQLALSFSIVCFLAAQANAQGALPLGTVQQGKAGAGAPAEYTLVAKTAGVLVAAVRGDGDLVLNVTDEDGQTLPDGSSDRDLNGSEGTEMISMVIPEPGTYRVRVRVQGGSNSAFQINGSWLPFPAFAAASPDPDRRPSSAKAGKVGAAIEDSLNTEAGDHWDWFAMKTTQSGTLAVITRRVGESDSDLVLEVYLDGNFSEPAGRSDQDLQGDSANESVTVSVKSGQQVHVKVAGAFSRANLRYRLSSSVIP